MRQHTTWSTLSAARRNWSAVTSALPPPPPPFFLLFNGHPSHDTSLFSTCGDRNGLASFKTSWKTILAFLKTITFECEPSDSLCGFKRCTASVTHFPTQQNQEKKASNDREHIVQYMTTDACILWLDRCILWTAVFVVGLRPHLIHVVFF